MKVDDEATKTELFHLINVGERKEDLVTKARSM